MNLTARTRMVVLLLAVLIAGMAAPYARAASPSLIRVATAQDLKVPPSAAPEGYTLQTTVDQPITAASMLPVLGQKVRNALRRDGWVTGYHGWLDSNDTTGAPFATYDLYGFKTSAGAEAALNDYAPLVLGVRIASNDRKLPRGALVSIDGTGTFDPNSQPFTVVEVVFRVDNVLADVSGYYAGGDTNATDGARVTAYDVTAALAAWLHSVSHPTKKG